jgi:hypothetical protein
MGRKTLPNPTRGQKPSSGQKLVAQMSGKELIAEMTETGLQALESVDQVHSAQYGVDATKTTSTERAMQEIGKTILRMEMKRAGVGYAGLAERLVKLGIPENEPNVRNRIARGKFSMGYFLACLRALGTKTINLDIEVPKAESLLDGHRR